MLPQLRKQLGRVHVSFGEPLLLDSMLDKVHAGWRQDPLDEDSRPAWFGDAVDAVAGEIMRRINAAAAVTPVNLLSVALLAAPRQAMLEHDLERQLQLYIDLLKSFPYSPDVSVAATDGAAIIKHGEQMGLLERRKHPLGDVLRMDERNAVLATYYRNNVLHLFAMPSLVACAFLNNSAMRHEDIQRLLWRVYPYVRAELCLRWREDELPGVVDGVLAALAKLGLLERDADGAVWRRSDDRQRRGGPPVSVLAQATIQAIERYYLAIALLLRAGRSTLTPEALEQRCVAMAQRMSMLYGLAAPEFFDKAMFRDFLDLLRQRGVIRLDGDGKLTFDDALRRGRRRRARRALRADPQQHPAGHAQLIRGPVLQCKAEPLIYPCANFQAVLALGNHMTKTFLRPVTALVAAILAPGVAQAVDFAAGGWNGSFDTTVSFGQSWREQGRDPRLIGTADGGSGRSPNIDDGDLNYKKGRVSSAYKVVAELSLDHDNYGLFVRGSLLYDDLVEDSKTARTPISEAGKDLAGSYLRLLDAFVYGRWDLGGHELDIRAGNQVVNWGESTFIQGGINAAINHFDVVGAARSGLGAARSLPAAGDG